MSFTDVKAARILVAGDRSLDPRWPRYSGDTPVGAQDRFIALLENTVARLAVVDGHVAPVVIVHGSGRFGADQWADAWVFQAWESKTLSRELLHAERHSADLDRYDSVTAWRVRDRNMVGSMDASAPHAVIVASAGRANLTREFIDLAVEAGLNVEVCT